ncbi:uncharacterized protein LOC126668423 [Mercurialis annua]|uniref:uncharacterized protein LOC126668423 n=1 Tax=Mercurialis annua TaxID=3986 RepID=UPI00215EF738|nr:uncharacterized protein LOC126668423 [Mercurialis annua]
MLLCLRMIKELSITPVTWSSSSIYGHVAWLHGLLETIVSERDVIFTSSFWSELFRLSGTKLCYSSAYHPQSDGKLKFSTEVASSSSSLLGCSKAYKLELPSTTKMHPFFHVSCLKKFIGNPNQEQSPLPTFTSHSTRPFPQAILDSRSKGTTKQVLVHWDGLSPAESSWEDVESLLQQFPSLALEDKCIF